VKDTVIAMLHLRSARTETEPFCSCAIEILPRSRLILSIGASTSVPTATRPRPRKTFSLRGLTDPEKASSPHARSAYYGTSIILLLPDLSKGSFLWA
jgi:hypothetical protein